MRRYAILMLITLSQFLEKFSRIVHGWIDSLYNETLCVWCFTPMEDEICFNSKNICISCCINAGDPCGH